MGLIADIVEKGWLLGGTIKLTKEEFSKTVYQIQIHGYVNVTDDKGYTWKLTLKPNSNPVASLNVSDIDVNLIRRPSLKERIYYKFFKK